jgi:tRNA1Val (adenine37-N6)-methyltransferase
MNKGFQFKQFSIAQDHCEMKVGTDGTLLGAWADVSISERILDIGTGTGLIALMVAQRSNATIVGIEIDEHAARQALENVQNCPWKERIRIVCKSIQEYTEDSLFDTIISNPPYFSKSLACPISRRNIARHTEILPFIDLITNANRLLTTTGQFCVIIPTECQADFIQLCWEQNLYLKRKTLVKTCIHKEPKRVLISFSHNQTVNPIYDDLIIENDDHSYTEQYKILTREFYLNF